MVKAIGFVVGSVLVFAGTLFVLKLPVPDSTANQDFMILSMPQTPTSAAGPAQLTDAPPRDTVTEQPVAPLPVTESSDPITVGSVAAPVLTPAADYVTATTGSAAETTVPEPDRVAPLNEASLADAPWPKANDPDFADTPAAASTAAGDTSDLANDQTGAPMLSGEPVAVSQWFSVWDPFHSQLSANAFARRLAKVTGLEFRVLSSGPGQHQVAVAYGSEAERVANIALIEETTGLQLAGSTP